MGGAEVTMRIEAVLFDVAGVVVSDPSEGFARYEATAGLPPGTIERLIAVNPGHNAWDRLRRGELDPAGFVEMFEFETAAAGFPASGTAVLEATAAVVRPRMATALVRCAERFRTALVTDDSTIHDDDSGLGDLRRVVDAVATPSRVGVAPREPDFYARACDLLGVDAAHGVLLDDAAENLAAARTAGMTTIAVRSVDDAVRALERLVGFPLAD